MDDVECPYCETFQEINHDDGYGYAENETHEQECSKCGKIFVYQTSIMYSYDVEICPCKNGEPHNLIDIKGCPSEYFVGKKTCTYCGDYIMIDEQAHIAAMESYRKSL